MLSHEHKQRVLGTLRSACKELKDALNLSVPTARYDPVVLSPAMRDELLVMVENLTRLIRHLEGAQ